MKEIFTRTPGDPQDRFITFIIADHENCRAQTAIVRLVLPILFLKLLKLEISEQIPSRSRMIKAKRSESLLLSARSDLAQRVKVFLHELLRALIGPIQADT